MSGTSYTELANLTLQTGSRCFKRLTNAYSKKSRTTRICRRFARCIKNSFRIHQTLRYKTAIAKVTAKPWELADMI